MRHLSIAIIFGALLLEGCDRRREANMPPQEEVAREEITVIEPAPISEPVAVAPVVQKKAAPQREVVKEEIVAEEPERLTETMPYVEEEVPVIYEEEILIQAEEERWPKNRGKTYNELQLSDDMDDYPFTPSTDDYNFNDRQYE